MADNSYYPSSLGSSSLRRLLLLPSLLDAFPSLVHAYRPIRLPARILQRPRPQRRLAHLVEAKAADEAAAPLLDDPVGGLDDVGEAALFELTRAQGDVLEEDEGVVGRGAELAVHGRVA